MKYFRNTLFNSMHDDWYMCESDHHSTKERTVRQKIKIVLDFYNGDPDVVDRCTFLLRPLPQTKNKYQNCKCSIGPELQNIINGQPPPQPPALVPPAPPRVLPVCIRTCSAGNGTGSSGVSAVGSPQQARRKHFV